MGLATRSGRRRSKDPQFAVAKIADDLSDLGPSFRFKLQHVTNYKLELVRVIRVEPGKPSLSSN